MPQRLDRVDARSAPGGNRARDGCDEHQYSADGEE
jgi:hypothetical protein